MIFLLKYAFLFAAYTVALVVIDRYFPMQLHAVVRVIDFVIDKIEALFGHKKP